MITSPDHVPPGVAIVTPYPTLSRRGQARVLEHELADSRLRPERPMGKAGARPSDTNRKRMSDCLGLQ